MGEEFIRGYLTLAEGEKDPRNLLLAFAIDRVLLVEFNVVNFIEVYSPIEGFGTFFLTARRTFST